MNNKPTVHWFENRISEIVDETVDIHSTSVRITCHNYVKKCLKKLLPEIIIKVEKDALKRKSRHFCREMERVWQANR